MSTEPGVEYFNTMGNDVHTLLDQIEELPPLPAVAAKVMAMADDDNCSALDLAQVLSADQALTAKMIKISNSAYYGFARKVSTVREAVVVLGFKQVQQLAVTTSLMNAWSQRPSKDEAFNMDLFWGHTVAVAIAAESIAKKSRVARPEDGFTAGILHDIGRLVLKMTMPDAFHEAVLLAREGTPLHQAELACTGYDHQVIGKALGEGWKFPGHLVDAVACHHDQRQTPAEDGLAGVVAQADRLILHYGLYCGYDLEGDVPPMPGDLARWEEACGGIDRVLERSFAFIESASGKPQRWFEAA
ncbi:MAG: HDOD domain-containing protein [Dehalococcoidia bacterium]|nr:HDOD domain-containing protein [Dehalococcoidia bacterium]